MRSCNAWGPVTVAHARLLPFRRDCGSIPGQHTHLPACEGSDAAFAGITDGTVRMAELEVYSTEEAELRLDDEDERGVRQLEGDAGEAQTR